MGIPHISTMNKIIDEIKEKDGHPAYSGPDKEYIGCPSCKLNWYYDTESDATDSIRKNGICLSCLKTLEERCAPNAPL